MAKSHNQKAKILFLVKLLLGTGENQVVTMQDILAQLTECGVSAERKSIYDDFEALREFGLDVKFKRGRPGGYYLADYGPFARWKEMSVQPGKAPGEITAEGAAAEQENALKPETGLEGARTEQKTAPEEGARTERKTALGEGARTERKTKPEGSMEESSGENGGKAGNGLPEPKGAAQASGSAGEWKFVRDGSGSEEKKMRLLCSLSREKEIREYFGDEGEYKERGYGNFTLAVPLRSSPSFYGWLASMEKDVYIVKPRKAAVAYREYLKKIAREYKGI